MKKLILSISIFLLVFFCPFIKGYTNEKPKFFTEEYSAFQLYESPFSPHATLRFWPVISSSVLSPDILYVRVGNPRIDWSNNDINEDAMKDVKAEILSVHYGFLIEVDKEGKRHLTLIIYSWKNQITGKVYRCSAKLDDMTYKMEEIKTKDKMKVNIKRFFNDFRYLQVVRY
jgi:hypothetical protein